SIFARFTRGYCTSQQLFRWQKVGKEDGVYLALSIADIDEGMILSILEGILKPLESSGQCPIYPWGPFGVVWLDARSTRIEFKCFDHFCDFIFAIAQPNVLFNKRAINIWKFLHDLSNSSSLPTCHKTMNPRGLVVEQCYDIWHISLLIILLPPK